MWYVGRTRLNVKTRDGETVPLFVHVIGTERGNKESAVSVHLMETEGNEIELGDGIEFDLDDLRKLTDGTYTDND